MNNTNSPETFITRLYIEELFGLYTYELTADNLKVFDYSRLLILYGDNGSGKTTLLKLIFNILSPADGRGHRTFVASVPFRRFIIELGLETTILLERLGENLIGTFNATIIRNGEMIFNNTFTTDKDNSVSGDDQPSGDYIKALKRLNITLFYLSDDRKTNTSLFEEENDVILRDWAVTDITNSSFVLYDGSYVHPSRYIKNSKLKSDSETVLEISLRKVENWIKAKALVGASEGEANTNSIYADIVKSITRTSRKELNTNLKISEIQELLQELEKQSRAFSTYSLISPLNFDTLLNSLNEAPVDTKPIVASVLRPYVEGLKARLNALKEIQNIIEIFIDSINSFLHNKLISYDLNKGILIRSRNGDELKSYMLSSGERQLILLFCNIITARDTASVFIIDEPEISLNVKWQRNLLKILLRCTEGTPVQFVIATHSLELLSQYRNHVLRLTDQNQSHA